MLNELDKDLEKRGHRFVRYADDMLIFCKSKSEVTPKSWTVNIIFTQERKEYSLESIKRV